VSWQQLIGIYREARDPAQRGDDIERDTCPNDGEPLQDGPSGQRYCPYDGFQWEGQGKAPTSLNSD
jgi:hypothetical protein